MLRSFEFKTTAAEVRTGQIISTPWSAYRRMEVETVTREKFVNHTEDYAAEVVRFTGWETDAAGRPVLNVDGERICRVIRGWAQRADGRIYVHAQLPWVDAFGSLSGRADADALAVELATFLRSAAA